MADLALRRRIAELRGWVDLVYIGVGWQGRPWPDGGMDDVPEWDCNLAAAGELWAEMVEGRQLIRIEEGELHDTFAWIEPPPGEANSLSIIVEAAEVPDPAERLARAIALIWLAWKEAGL
jgi:hypothetical protein